jgi:hypothetical protein
MNEINTVCLECGVEIPQTKGKRKREFCSSSCRSNAWQKARRKEKEPKPLPPSPEVEKTPKPTVTKLTKKVMPIGLSATDQIQWRIDNG